MSSPAPLWPPPARLSGRARDAPRMPRRRLPGALAASFPLSGRSLTPAPRRCRITPGPRGRSRGPCQLHFQRRSIPRSQVRARGGVRRVFAVAGDGGSRREVRPMRHGHVSVPYRTWPLHTSAASKRARGGAGRPALMNPGLEGGRHSETTHRCAASSCKVRHGSVWRGVVNEVLLSQGFQRRRAGGLASRLTDAQGDVR